MTPRIALFTGDPAGIGPELVQQLLADPQTAVRADVVLIGHQAISDQAGPTGSKAVTVHQWPGSQASGFERGIAGQRNGRFMLDALTEGVNLVTRGQADALCFAPLNKTALRAGGMHHEDELRWFAELLKHDAHCGELNVLEDLWTSRVTSHVPLRDVSALLSVEKVAEAIVMITQALRASGKAAPRIAV